MTSSRNVSERVRLFDAHCHIIDPQYPLIANQGFLPEPFTADDYLERFDPYDLIGGAVVSGSFQGFDQSYFAPALARLGPSFVGVTQLPPTVSDEQLITLNGQGIRGLRFNIRRGGSERLRGLDHMARRVHELVGWHVELYVDANALEPVATVLASLPAVSIDHVGLSGAGQPALLRLAEHGVRVKASGFGRVDFEVPPALRDLYQANPNALMFGTDLPSTRAPRGFDHSDVALVLDTFDSEQAERVLYQNAMEFYRIAV